MACPDANPPNSKAESSPDAKPQKPKSKSSKGVDAGNEEEGGKSQGKSNKGKSNKGKAKAEADSIVRSPKTKRKRKQHVCYCSTCRGKKAYACFETIKKHLKKEKVQFYNHLD